MNAKKRFKTGVFLAMAVILALVLPVRAGAFKDSLGILKPAVLDANNPATGKPWTKGDTYRFAFYTSGTITGQSADIEDYNTWVQGLANASAFYDIGAVEGVTWKVIGSTNDVDARDNTSTNPTVETGCAIFLLDGSTLVAAGNEDLWDGEVQHIIDLTEQGTIETGWPITGTYKDGTRAPGHNASYSALGGGGQIAQSDSSVASNWVWRTWTGTSSTNSRHMYALSDPLVVVGDPNLPDVDVLTPDTISWSGGLVVLDATVVNNDTSVPQGNLTYSWTAEPGSAENPNLTYVITDGDKEDAAVKIIKTVPTGDVTVVTMTLSVNLEGMAPISDTMTIDVYDDACKAGIAVGQVTFDPSDFNGDCRTDIEDIAVLAGKWLLNYSITEPTAKQLNTDRKL